MLTEQRYEIILGLLREKNSVTVTELKDILDASESTVRRDITALYKAGRLTRVFGGAVALEHTVNAYEPTVAQKVELNIEEKKKIAAYAAALIRPEDFSIDPSFNLKENVHGNDYRIYVGTSGRLRGDFCHQWCFPCQGSGSDGSSCIADRRRAEGIYGSCDRKSGHADAEELSFYQGLFRDQWDDSERRFYHAGIQ